MPDGKPLAIQIDEGVPLPPHGSAKIVWRTMLAMKKDQSFFQPADEKRRHCIVVTASRFNVKHRDKRLTTHKVTEHGVEGIRVWRVV